MASQRITTLFVCLLAGLCTLSSLAASAMAEDPMEWQFSEFDDPENAGRKIASLIYGVPETDNIRVSGVCQAASPGAPFSNVTLATDIGDLESGKDVELRFSGGGFDHVLKGKIQRATGEGISGVLVPVEADDPLWTAMAEKASLDYLVPGYKAATLDFDRGKSAIPEFVQACRNFANADFSPQPARSPGSSGDPEKDAFESAKELGTIEAWQAFLTNYPSGFHADLARAYVKQLEDTDAARSQGRCACNPKSRRPRAQEGGAESRKRLRQGTDQARRKVHRQEPGRELLRPGLSPARRQMRAGLLSAEEAHGEQPSRQERLQARRSLERARRLPLGRLSAVSEWL
jgi:hypothetical protein